MLGHQKRTYFSQHTYFNIILSNMRCSGYLKIVVLVVCLALSIVQITLAIMKVISKPTMTSSGTKSLKALDRSIVVSVCKTSQTDWDRLKSLGYNEYYDWFSGNVSSGTILSWTGAQGNMTLDEVLHFLYHDDDTEIKFDLINGTVGTKFLPFHGFCKTYEMYPKNYLVLAIKNCSKSDSFLVTLYDPGAVNSFQLARMPGGRIQYECKNEHQSLDYNVQLSETVDVSGGDACAEYPTKYHNSYTHCTDNEIAGKTQSVFGYGLPFITKSGGEPIQRLPEHESMVGWLEHLALFSYGGVKYQSEHCLPPCTMLTANTELQQSSKAPNGVNHSALYLFFDEIIHVQTTVVAYGPESLLVEIGSCLGLWLGLSVIRFFDMTIGMFEKGAKSLKMN